MDGSLILCMLFLFGIIYGYFKFYHPRRKEEVLYSVFIIVECKEKLNFLADVDQTDIIEELGSVITFAKKKLQGIFKVMKRLDRRSGGYLVRGSWENHTPENATLIVDLESLSKMRELKEIIKDGKMGEGMDDLFTLKFKDESVSVGIDSRGFFLQHHY